MLLEAQALFKESHYSNTAKAEEMENNQIVMQVSANYSLISSKLKRLKAWSKSVTFKASNIQKHKS